MMDKVIKMEVVPSITVKKELEMLTEEEYVIQRAKFALNNDPVSAKAWMITAKTLYPNNFGVQFEAYYIEKSAGHVKEAAKCFSDLIGKFQQQPEFWTEIDNVTSALRSEAESTDPEKQFLCEMFKHISTDVQHKLLLLTAEHCEDTMEHCKLLLLLLQKFPGAIASHGPGLVDTLLSAEKHSHSGTQPVNPYRKLLVCDLLPLLASENVAIELNPKMIFKLLHKAIEFYLCSLSLKTPPQDSDRKNEQPWTKLFNLLEFTGRLMGWEPYLLSFSNNWTKETYWQKLMTFCQSHSLNLEDPNVSKQLLYCLTVFFLHCLYDYNASLTPEAPPGQPNITYTLLEMFIDPNLPSPTDPKTKRRKTEVDVSVPYISIEKSEQKVISSNFLMAVHCWDLLHSSEHLQREFGKICAHLKVEASLSSFMIDHAIYKGRFDEAFSRLQQESDTNTYMSRCLKSASILYLKKNFAKSFENILQVIPALPSGNPGALSTSLIVGGPQRHLHFLPMTEMAILQFCVKLLVRCILETMIKHQSYNELAIGNILVLAQLDWPQEEELIPSLLEQIKAKGSFHYYLFQSYIINVDILEELTYLWTNQGGQITLDIVPHLGQRRIGTRGADKGVKEEIKQAIRRQIARSNENIGQLVLTFIMQERSYILQTLM